MDKYDVYISTFLNHSKLLLRKINLLIKLFICQILYIIKKYGRGNNNETNLELCSARPI